MKKYLITFLCVVLALSSVAHTNWEGSWRTGNTVYTFNCDTLYVDEIGIEGDCYTCTYNGDTIIAKNEFDSFKLIVKQVKNNKINVTYFDDEVVESFNLKKMRKYNLFDM